MFTDSEDLKKLAYDQKTETNIKWDKATMALSDVIADEINKVILKQILKHDKTNSASNKSKNP